MKLCELIPGQRAEVVSVNAGGVQAARLRALGIAASIVEQQGDKHRRKDK